MPAALSTLQKRTLAQLAGRAFAHRAAECRAAGEYFYDDIPASRALAEFRHTEVARACGKRGLRCCDQNDFQLVRAHFLNLLGETGAALAAMVRGANNDRRVAEFKLLEACRTAGVHLAYADRICRSMNHGSGLDDVDGRALWKIIFTVKKRTAQRQPVTA